MRWLITVMIRVYQGTLSPMIGPCCRFYPSCSQYCLEAVQAHGCVRGLGLGIKRILKCHPFHPGGVDLVPPPEPAVPEEGERMSSRGAAGPDDGSM
jgi:putative membrane protein insertion efficiency factor